MKTVTFPDGETRPALGLGTWRMGESARQRQAEVAAVRSAIEMGYRVVDTAEMYGEGAAEEIVGFARETEARLIVLGLRREYPPGGTFSRVLPAAPCPVLVVTAERGSARPGEPGVAARATCVASGG